MMRFNRLRICIAIYPREGTETRRILNMVLRPTIAIYPREGTETQMHPAGMMVYQYCNLSPRGDGNSTGKG